MKQSKTKPNPVKTLEDVVAAVHGAGGCVSISLEPKSGTEATLLRALEIQQTIKHGLQGGMTIHAVELLVSATIETLQQARSELRKPKTTAHLNPPG